MLASLGIPNDQLLLLGAAGGVAVLVALAMRRYPKSAVILWVATVCFVPYWMGVSVGPYFPPTSAVAALVVLAIVRIRAPRIAMPDVLLGVFAIIVILGFVLGVSTIASLFTALAIWGAGFAVGRMAPAAVDVRWIYGAIAVLFSIVAVLALAEFATGRNVFSALPGDAQQIDSWARLQERGGLLRAEGAFGHSIALGSSIALAIPLVLVSRFSAVVRGGMVMLLLAACIVTFSRTGMICAGLALVLTVLFVRDGIPRGLRLFLIFSAVIVGAAASALVIGTFDAAGDEATVSAEYRGDLFGLLPTLRVIGMASIFERGADGTAYFGEFASIDNALLLLGLTYGIVAGVLMLLLLIVAGILVLRRVATAPTIAVVAQAPAFVTVALITQYSAFFWFVVGLAISTQVAERTAARARLLRDSLDPTPTSRIIDPSGPPAPVVDAPLPRGHLR